MKTRILVSSMIALSVGVGTCWAAPAMDGSALLEERCSVCHKSDRPKSAKKSKEEWQKTVTRMIGKGAKLSDKEKATLIDYLSASSG